MKSLDPYQVSTESGIDGNTPAIQDGTLTYVELSVPVLLLPAGSTAVDVPADTPVGTIILVKA